MPQTEPTQPPAQHSASYSRRLLFSRVLWPRFSAGAMAAGEGEYRQRLLDGLRGRVIEIGAGPGLNFAYHPPEVTDVLAVETRAEPPPTGD
ncbi:MAG: hypothetical protein ACR2KV_00615 [Solirubrobacteraceae bacterium]